VTPSGDIGELAVGLLGKSADTLTSAERRVLERIRRRQTTSGEPSVIHDENSSFGQRLADHVAAVGGSWGFIIAFGVVLFGWMLLNSGILPDFGLVFDPYPFIFLNLMLSMLAAIQAPVIMMSQNRQSTKDRQAAAHDYEVNLRAELELIRLHEKVNRLLADNESSAKESPAHD
jgi:uncharacterized membrane protein